MVGCIWSCYGVKCNSEFVNSDNFCSDHANKTCGNCGMKATEGCNNCGQFVCGSPMCIKCGACCVEHGAKRERAIPRLTKIDDVKHLNKKDLLNILEGYIKRENAIIIEKWKQSLS